MNTLHEDIHSLDVAGADARRGAELLGVAGKRVLDWVPSTILVDPAPPGYPFPSFFGLLGGLISWARMKTRLGKALAEWGRKWPDAPEADKRDIVAAIRLLSETGRFGKTIEQALAT